MLYRSQISQIFYHEEHEEYSHRGHRVFASRCGLGSGFLDTSICEACGQRPLGHKDGPHKNMQGGKIRNTKHEIRNNIKI